MAAPQYNTGFTDAESVNNSSQSTFIYKDLSLFFTRNPVTSDVSTVTDVQDIKRAVKHIVLLNPGEKPFHPEIGTGVRQSLFENFTPPVRETLRGKIEFSLQKYEPRVTVTSVVFEDTSDFKNMDNNTLIVQINFYLNNIPQQIESVEVMLERLR